MKLSIIRTDRQRQKHLSTIEMAKAIEKLTEQTKTDTVGEARHTLRYYVDDPNLRPDIISQMPRLYPSVELRRDADGNFVMKQFNGVLLLNVKGLRNKEEAETIKTKVQGLPMTLAAFMGLSEKSVKVLVAVSRSDGSMPASEAEAERFCQRAYPMVVAIYEALLGRRLTQTVATLRASYRQTQDARPYYQPKATPMLISELAAAQPDMAPNTTAETETEADEKVINSTRQLITFINDHYQLRHNTVMGYTEFLPKKRMHASWEPVDDRVKNSIAMEARLAGLNVWDKDINRYLRSTMVKDYNPIEEYLWRIEGKWDGKDHIGRLAATVPSDNDKWPLWFRRWLLAMVAQWMGRNHRYGNAIVPLLISTQGFNKSTFCRSLIPSELQWGYNDNLQLQDKKQVLQQMGQMLLINLDEFNQISPAVQQGFLKNLVSLPSVKVKRPYGRHVEEFPRLASFIATTNLADVLTDESGSRRFIGIELKGPIDVSVQPNHEQLYAQALHLLREGERYWFDEDETREIMMNNLRFKRRLPAEQLFVDHFEPAANELEGEYLSASTIFTELRHAAGSILKPTGLTTFGRILAGIPGIQHRRTRVGTEYLVKRKK